MANAIEHDHVQGADALDVFGARLVGVWIEPGRNQRHHLGLVADDVAYVAVVRVQGDADSQGFAVLGLGQGRQGAGQEQGEDAANEDGAQHGESLDSVTVLAGDPGVVVADDLLPAGGDQCFLAQIVRHQRCAVATQPDVGLAIGVSRQDQQEAAGYLGIWLLPR